MPDRPPHNGARSLPERGRVRRIALRLGALMAAMAVSLGPLALTGAAAGELTMEARVLLQGHTRAGAWTAIQVNLANDGPTIVGELRMAGGEQSNARYSMAVNLPTGSRQTYVLHAQPPAFGRNVKVDLVVDERTVESADIAYLAHDASQLVIGVLAERPGPIVAQIKLPNSPTGAAPAVVPLTIADLPERAEGWTPLDRLVWQDVDSNQLTAGQLEALRRWLAAGGRLVIVGGSAGLGTLSQFPDDILPYRPTATLDIDPETLASFLGPLPDTAADLPAMGGELTRGRALARSGDRAIAAEVSYGGGRVTLLGFDPTTAWLAESDLVDPLWRGVLPDRAGDGSILVDDSQLVQAVYQLPALALPPTSGLLAIIAAYILVIGPINYLILRRLDRRELAWVTMPVLVLAFAAVSFGYGSFLRGTDVVVNEVAIVRGAPDATEATAQVYFGIFSPTRSTYRVDLPQGALLASPITGGGFGQVTGALDLVQGTGPERPSAVRNLSVGTGSIRIVRAQLPVAAPRMKANLTLEGNMLTGTFENASDQALESVAVVLGTSVVVLGDVPAGTTRDVRLPIQDNRFGSGLADQVVGASFDTTSEAGVRRQTRYAMVQQLTFDPTGMGNTLPADQAVILAFGRGQTLELNVGSQAPRRNANTLYYVPVGMSIRGNVTFTADLLRSTVVDSDAQFFSKDRFFLSMGAGQATIAYRPIPFEGAFDVSEIRFSMSAGGGIGPLPANAEIVSPIADVPEPCIDLAGEVPEGCVPPRDDFLPEVEVFDRTGEGAWRRLPRLTGDASYRLEDPDRYVDPASGQMLVRFVHENLQSSSNFGFQLALLGDVQ